MTDIEKTKAEIKVLEKKLYFEVYVNDRGHLKNWHRSTPQVLLLVYNDFISNQTDD